MHLPQPGNFKQLCVSRTCGVGTGGVRVDKGGRSGR